jgi:DNA-binding CsgD family transcriptional regulator
MTHAILRTLYYFKIKHLRQQKFFLKLKAVMPTAGATIRHLFVLFVFLQANYLSFSQTTSSVDDLGKNLGSKNFISANLEKTLLELKDKDSSQVAALLDGLEKKGYSSASYYNAHLNFLRAMWLARTGSSLVAKTAVTKFIKEALNAAYEVDDDSLVSNISWNYGQYMFGCSEMEPAAMYCLYAAEIDEKIGRIISASKYQLLGDVLYNTRDYEKAIYYTHLAIENQTDTSAYARSIILSRWNTIGLCWQKLGMYDSAFFSYNIAMKMAKETNSNIWKSIIGGNMGQVYFLQKKYALAKPLLELDYAVSKAYGEMNSAVNSLQWAARINLIEGKKDSALAQVQEAMLLLREENSASYFYYYANLCSATADVYRAFGNYDSADRYSQLYNHVHDSLERSAATSRLEIARIKLDNIQNALAIKNLHKEKETEKTKRNFILAFIVMFAAIVILVLNRQRLKSIHQQQLALQEKVVAQAEVVSAREQLNMFKQNIIEKTDLIEKLQQQVHNRETSDEQVEIINELSRQTILTEEDWDKFKSLFEKIYPGFLIKLKEKAPDITVAEQRMAALTRLHLTSKQIASMLGISVDSVHKSRQRLRQRLQLHVDSNLEETIAAL